MTFWNRKIVLVSTPTNKGASRIETAYEESDQHQYHVPCPECGTEQVLAWPQVKWGKTAGGAHQPETAKYHCIHCDVAWRDETRWAAVRKGHWQAREPFTGIAGFHLNEIYSPWVRLEAMVKAFLSARAGGAGTDSRRGLARLRLLGRVWFQIPAQAWPMAISKSRGASVGVFDYRKNFHWIFQWTFL